MERNLPMPSDSDSVVQQEQENDDDNDVHQLPTRNSNYSSTSAYLDEPNQIKNRRMKRSNINLRKSMAWNNAFFTEQGVLNSQELSRLNGCSSKLNKEFLSDILEEEAKPLVDDSVSSRSNAQHLRGTLFHKLPVRPVSSGPKVITKSPKLDTAWENTALGLKLVKVGNNSLLKAGGSPKTLGSASHKRLPSMALGNLQMKDLKTPRFAVSKEGNPSFFAAPKVSSVGAKHLNCIRTRQEDNSHWMTPPAPERGGKCNLEKNISPEGFSSFSMTTLRCTPLTAGPSTLSSGKNMACEASTGLEVILDRLPTSDANTSKAVIPRSQKAFSGKLASAICPTKPSGLRMPSPSLRYFSQPQAPVSQCVKSPRDAPTCNSSKDSNPVPRTFYDTYHTGERGSSHKLAGTVRMAELGLNGKKSLTAAAKKTSHPSAKFNTEVKRSVGETFQDSSLGISKRKVCGVDEVKFLIQDQHGEKAHELSESKTLSDVDSKKAVRSEVLQLEELESESLIHHEVEKAKHGDNYLSQENPEKRILEYSSKVNDIENSGGNTSKFKFSSMDAGNTHLSHSNGCELCFEAKNTVQSGCTKEFQVDGMLGNLHDLSTEDEDFSVGDLDSLPLLNSELHNYGVSGEDCLKRSTVDNRGRNSLVHSNFLHGSNCIHTLSEVQKEHMVLSEVQNSLHEESRIELMRNDGLAEQESTSQQSLEDSDVNITSSGLKIGDPFSYTETTDLYDPMISCEKKWQLDNSDVTAENKDSILQKKRKSSFDSRHDAISLKHKLNAAPFSEEWLAALEEAGEEILTMKTGAVQNSPPEKSLPQPGPWSPVKRKNIPDLGPFDCTKYTNLPLPDVD